MKNKLCRTAGIWNLVMGIVEIVTGVTAGVLLLINAVRLLKSDGLL